MYGDVENILDGFDFDKVKEVMTKLEWKWFRYLGEEESQNDVPTTYQLIQCALDLLWRCKIDDLEECSTGGFVARMNNKKLSLSFEISYFEYNYETINENGELK